MEFSTSPYLLKNASVQRVMLQVLAALLPGIAAYVWVFGSIILLQLVIATVTALLAEAAMLKLREKPLGLFLSDGSAIVTAWLIAPRTSPPSGVTRRSPRALRPTRRGSPRTSASARTSCC